MPAVVWSPALRRRFDATLLALGRLDAVTGLLPNASLLLYRFLRKEAVLSSQIEGTQSSLADLLLYEIIESCATQAVSTAHRLRELVDSDRDRIATLRRAATSAIAVHKALQRRPIATSATPVEATQLTAVTVNKSLAHLERIGVVNEMTNRARGRVFSYGRYVRELAAEAAPG